MHNLGYGAFVPCFDAVHWYRGAVYCVGTAHQYSALVLRDSALVLRGSTLKLRGSTLVLRGSALLQRDSA